MSDRSARLLRDSGALFTLYTASISPLDYRNQVAAKYPNTRHHGSVR